MRIDTIIKKFNRFICRVLFYRFIKSYLIDTAFADQSQVDRLKGLVIHSPEQTKQYHFLQGRVNAYVEIIRYLSD